MTYFLDNLISRVVRLVIFRAVWCLLGYLILSVCAVIAIIQFLGVDTDSSKMLSSSLGFQQKTQAFNRDFPNIKNTIIVVVRSDIVDAADATARELVSRLSKSTRVKNVFSSSVDSFFQKNGLLYQDVDELETQLDQLNKSASLLASLREDSSLVNFFHSLFTAEELAEKAEFERSFLDDFYADADETIKARLVGSFAPLSWAKTQNSSVSDEEGGVYQRLVYATPILNFDVIQPAKQSFTAVQTAIDELTDDLKTITEIGVTGDPVLRFEELRSVSRGIGLSLVLSFVLVGVLLLLAFRSLGQMLLTLIALMAALVLSTGFAALVFGKLNLVSVAFVVLLVGLGLDFTIHVLAHLKDQNAATVSDGLTGMACSIGTALFLSAVTTALAFLSFSPTDFVGMAQLGVLGAFGVIGAFFLSITLIPAMITVFPWFGIGKGCACGRMPGNKFTLSKIMLVARKPLAVLLVVVTVGAAFFAGDVRFDADPVALRDPESPSMRTFTSLHEKRETVPYRLSLLRADEPSARLAAEEVEKLESVDKARLLSDFVPKDQQDKLDLIDLSIPTLDNVVNGQGLENSILPVGKSSLEALRDHLLNTSERPAAKKFAVTIEKLLARDEVTQKSVERDLFRFFPDLIATIDTQLGVDSVTLDDLPRFFFSRFQSEDGRWRVDVSPKGDVRDPSILKAFVNDVEMFDSNTAGAPMQIVNAGIAVSSAMIMAVLFASVAILTISFLVLRRWTLVLSIFIPLAMAGLVTAGASVFFNIPFNYANVIVLPLLIGLGVDSGIHVAMRRNQVRDSTALYATSTPRAVLFSGLTTIAAFATLSVSDHRGTASMGQMLAIAITGTLLMTIIITPMLMDFFKKYVRD